MASIHSDGSLGRNRTKTQSIAGAGSHIGNDPSLTWIIISIIITWKEKKKNGKGRKAKDASRIYHLVQMVAGLVYNHRWAFWANIKSTKYAQRGDVQNPVIWKILKSSSSSAATQACKSGCLSGERQALQAHGKSKARSKSADVTSASASAQPQCRGFVLNPNRASGTPPSAENDWP